MNVLIFLVPVSLLLALGALAAFIWTIKNGQYDDLEGDAERLFGNTQEKDP